MTDFGTFIAIAGSLSGVIIGAVLQSYFAKKNQKDTRLSEWRNTAYTDFINAATLVATAQRQGKRETVSDYLAKLSDAKARICVYGDAHVINQLAEFWRHGATLQTESEILAFTRLCLTIRKSLGISEKIYSPDISQLLFSIDIKDTKTPKQNNPTSK